MEPLLSAGKKSSKEILYDTDFIERRIAELTATNQLYLEVDTPIQIGDRILGKITKRTLLNSDTLNQTSTSGGHTVKGVSIPYQYASGDADSSLEGSIVLNFRNISRYKFLIGGNWQTLEGRLLNETPVTLDRSSTNRALLQSL